MVHCFCDRVRRWWWLRLFFKVWQCAMLSLDVKYNVQPYSLWFVFLVFDHGKSQMFTAIWENMFGTFSKHLKQIQEQLQVFGYFPWFCGLLRPSVFFCDAPATLKSVVLLNKSIFLEMCHVYLERVYTIHNMIEVRNHPDIMSLTVKDD